MQTLEKENPMTKHAAILLTVLALLLVGGPGLHAQASDNDGCSDTTLKGDYAFTISGQILHNDGTIDTRNGVAMRNFDGRGNITFIDYVASLTPGRVPPGGIDLNPVFRGGLTGTYHVNTDCTGTAELEFPAPPGATSGQVIKLIFVLSDHGREIHAVVTSLVPAGLDKPVPVIIHTDGKKLRD
jgi:hypothetical protein